MRLQFAGRGPEVIDRTDNLNYISSVCLKPAPRSNQYFLYTNNKIAHLFACVVTPIPG